MLFVRLKPRLHGNVTPSIIKINNRKYSAEPAVTQNNESEVPKYPPIEDLSYYGKGHKIEAQNAKDVETLNTVEEKMLKINMPRYYGWKSVMLNEGRIPYNSEEQMQFYTRTHIVNERGLPSYYDNIVTPEKLQDSVEKIKGVIEDTLVFEYNNRNQLPELDIKTLSNSEMLDNFVAKSVSNHIHRALANHFAKDSPHILETAIDHDPRIEAFWFVGGIPPPTVIKDLKRRAGIQKAYLNDPVDRPVQYIGCPILQMRHNLPLPEIVPLSESENSKYNVPSFTYETRSTGLALERRHGTNIPGFWPGDSSEFGLISYHKCGHLSARNPNFKDTFDALKVQATLGNWGWLLSQACNLGFSIYNDVTYPLTNQMIITNGKMWTFCVYQLNTILVRSYHMEENPRRNILWMSEPMQLFDEIEENKIHGLNTKVLEHLVKFYANAPRQREGVNMKPYLGTRVKVIADYKHVERRVWLEDRFKHIVSNRPRHRRLPEIYDWQKIYLLKFKTRPIDQKREPWEFGNFQWRRKLDDHHAKYVPKALRADKRKRPWLKWAKNFYP